MAIGLRDVQRDAIANRALKELMRHYTVAEEKNRSFTPHRCNNAEFGKVRPDRIDDSRLLAD
jgi:hypothetical protein